MNYSEIVKYKKKLDAVKGLIDCYKSGIKISDILKKIANGEFTESENIFFLDEDRKEQRVDYFVSGMLLAECFQLSSTQTGKLGSMILISKEAGMELGNSAQHAENILKNLIEDIIEISGIN